MADGDRSSIAPCGALHAYGCGAAQQSRFERRRKGNVFRARCTWPQGRSIRTPPKSETAAHREGAATNISGIY